MKSMPSFVFVAAVVAITLTAFAYAQSQEEIVPSGRDYVPYTENYNVRFDSEGRIDYDLLIAKIMPDIFEKKLREQGVDIAQQDIVLNRGPQIAMYQPSSYNCGYVIDYTDNQVYWLEAAINSQEIEYVRIFTDTPTPDFPDTPPGFEIEEFNLGWCFGPLKQQVAAIFLEDKSYLTDDEEAMVAAAIKHELRGNPNLNHQEFTVGKFNFDYGDNVLSFCGEFQKPMHGLGYFVGALENGVLKDFSLESGMSSLCAIKEDATVYDMKFKENTNHDESLQQWKNIRMEMVYLKPSSAEKLLERNYMFVENVHNMILQYATSFEVEFIEFRPEASGTLFYFQQTEQDTFAKIRVPQNGANYFMSYGPNEWNNGDITNVIISVEEDDPKYKQQPFVESPNAPYPQYYTDYIFKVPKGSTMMAIVLEIENYKPDSDHSPDEWAGYRPS